MSLVSGAIGALVLVVVVGWLMGLTRVLLRARREKTGRPHDAGGSSASAAAFDRYVEAFAPHVSARMEMRFAKELEADEVVDRVGVDGAKLLRELVTEAQRTPRSFVVRSLRARDNPAHSGNEDLWSFKFHRKQFAKATEQTMSRERKKGVAVCLDVALDEWTWGLFDGVLHPTRTTEIGRKSMWAFVGDRKQCERRFVQSFEPLPRLADQTVTEAELAYTTSLARLGEARQAERERLEALAHAARTKSRADARRAWDEADT
jgi:uncharacterized protein (DUF885 family)